MIYYMYRHTVETSNKRTRINRSTNDSTKRIPSAIIEPIVKIIVSLFNEMFSCTIVEIPEEIWLIVSIALC